MHASYDPAAGCFTHLEITDVHGAESLTRGPALPGDIHIADRGYAQAKGLHRILEDGSDFIVRTGWRKVRLRHMNDTQFDLFAMLPEADYDRPVDYPVDIKGSTKETDVPARLIILRKPPQATEQERKRLRRTASKKGSKLNPASLVAAEYMLLLTSLPAEEFDANSIAELYRIRWQIELAFKRLKSLIHIDRLPAKDPALARSWLLSHLILALLIERQSEECLSHVPPDQNRQERTPSLWRINKLLLQALLSAIQGIWDTSGITGKARSFWRAMCEPPRKRKVQRIPKHNLLS
ncbi:transposase [Pseudovibrio sp. WM33]|uniref:transposase n=1 Tax=Pseudovibrio sp. WM33 TaxID=1735585 RepID=UPI0023AABE80|nr:transposase [Pseudovibrio sp. WM33]